MSSSFLKIFTNRRIFPWSSQIRSLMPGCWDSSAEMTAATQVKLSEEELAAIHEVSRLPAEYPGWMFERQGDIRRKQLAEGRRKQQAQPAAGGLCADKGRPNTASKAQLKAKV